MLIKYLSKLNGKLYIKIKIMKLELKHLAPYLPYDLKTINYNVGKLLDRPLISKMITSNITCFIDGSTAQKIILRPLSDLTKEIEHNGEKFVPIKKLKRGGTDNESVYTIEDWNGTNYVCSDNESHELRFSAKTGFDRRYNCESRQIYAYDLFEKLFEWHFDVFGLIEKGLAIDINTI